MHNKSLRKDINIQSNSSFTRFKEELRKANPFADVLGKSFRIKLNWGAEELIRSSIKENNYLTSRDKKEIVYILNKNDRRDILSIYIQELAGIGKSNKAEDIYLLAATKIASVLSTINTNNKKLVSFMINQRYNLRDLALDFAKKSSKDFHNQLEKHFENNYEKSVDLKKYKTTELFDQYYTKNMNLYVMFETIANKFDNTVDNLKVLKALAKYSVLFESLANEVSSKGKNKFVSLNTYELISKDSLDSFNAVKGELELKGVDFTHSFLTHITEYRNYVHLSDMPPITKKEIVLLSLNYLFLVFWAFIVIAPIATMVYLSFQGAGRNYIGDHNTAGFADEGMFYHYKQLWNETQFKSWLGNSLYIAGVTTVIIVIFTTFVAYAFSRFNFAGKRESLITVMLLQMIPNVVALTAILVLFKLASDGLNISMHTFLILIYSGGGIAGNTFILKGYFDSIPRDLDDAASIDGASKIRTFATILVPLAKPMIAIIALWSFIGPFGDVILPRLLTGTRPDDIKLYTMAAGLHTLVTPTGTAIYPYQYTYLAGAFLTSLPLTIGFLIAQRYMVGGLTSGAVK